MKDLMKESEKSVLARIKFNMKQEMDGLILDRYEKEGQLVTINLRIGYLSEKSEVDYFNDNMINTNTR